jgi:hypothetical protein
MHNNNSDAYTSIYTDKFKFRATLTCSDMKQVTCYLSVNVSVSVFHT